MNVAVVTDLHFGYPQTQTRLDSLRQKIARLPRATQALFVCGDTFTLAGKARWDPLIQRVASDSERETLRQISVEMVDTLMPQIEEAVGEWEKLVLYMIPGNADALAYQYLTERATTSHQVQLNDGKSIGHPAGLKIEGLGAITPDCRDAEEINRLNPWYRGVRSAAMFGEELIALAFSGYDLLDRSLGPTVLMTHMPAFGHVDTYANVNQGSRQVFGYINSTQPLLHVAGHVHDGSFSGGEYQPCSVVGEHTLSLNAGGGPNHDSPSGVRMLTVDLNILMAARFCGTLSTEARDAVRSLD